MLMNAEYLANLGTVLSTSDFGSVRTAFVPGSLAAVTANSGNGSVAVVDFRPIGSVRLRHFQTDLISHA
jgi:hypothetical protein